MDRVLRNAASVVQVTNYDGTGAPANIAGQWTANVVDGAGVAIAGSPFNATNPDVGIYQLAVGPLGVLDLYRVTWNVPDGSKRGTEFEVTGGFYFSIAEAQAFDAEIIGVTPPEVIEAAREVVEEDFEKETRVAWVPRGRRVLLDGSTMDLLMLPDLLPRVVISAAISGVAFTAGELADLRYYDTGALIRGDRGIWPWGRRNVALLYEHGFDQPPAPIVRAALLYLKYLLTPSPLEDNPRATAQFTDVGAFRIAIAGRDGPLGLPDVDAALGRFGRGRPGFA